MEKYSAKQLAELAGITVKTLYHYDKIGLLVPGERTENGYRFYFRKELLKLQQILFFRELDFSLENIIKILNDARFDTLKELESQRLLLIQRAKRFNKLIGTIDKTINEIKNNKGNNIMLTDAELYDGFTPQQAQEYRNEAVNNWGEGTIAQSEARLKKLGKEGFELLKKRGDDITQQLAGLMDKHPGHPDVQKAIHDYFDYMQNYFDCTPEIFSGLGQMYVDDKRFTAYYEKYAPGLAVFVNKAIQYYVTEGKGSLNYLSFPIEYTLQ